MKKFEVKIVCQVEVTLPLVDAADALEAHKIAIDIFMKSPDEYIKKYGTHQDGLIHVASRLATSQ